MLIMTTIMQQIFPIPSFRHFDHFSTTLETLFVLLHRPAVQP